MAYLKRFLEVDHDFYDIVGARVYSEVLGWYRKRLKDPYTLVGLIDGLWAGFANGRLMNEDINISLHTMALVRGGRIGAAMYYAKAYYGFEILGNKEWWATYESYNGWMRWGLGMAQPSYPWPDVQHELGGARVYYVTKKYWDQTVKNYVHQMVGADLNFDVPDEVIKANEVMRVPEEVAGLNLKPTIRFPKGTPGSFSGVLDLKLQIRMRTDSQCHTQQCIPTGGTAVA